MNAMMPAKLTPLLNSTAASGMLPIDPMKVKNAAAGPTSACKTSCPAVGSPLPAPANNEWKKLWGTKAAMTPATVNPMVTSFQTMPHSIR